MEHTEASAMLPGGSSDKRLCSQHQRRLWRRCELLDACKLNCVVPRQFVTLTRCDARCETAVTNDLAALKVLVSTDKLDVTSRDHAYRTALHLAASQGNLEMVEYLLAQGNPCLKPELTLARVF